jgi:hypothetical protein
MSDGLDELRALFPEWAFTIHWATVSSGADYRVIYARCGGHTLSAPDPSALAEKIRQELNSR